MTVRPEGALAPLAVRPVEMARRAAPPAVDPAVAEFRPGAHEMPGFFVWTLGCQMNLSDSEEMAGQLLAVGCERGALDGAGRPDRHQHLRRPRARRGEGHRPPGPARRAQEGEARPAGRADRLRRPRVRTRRPGSTLPGGRHVPAARRGARAGAAAGAGLRAGSRRPADGGDRGHDRRLRQARQRRGPSGAQPRHGPGRGPRRPLFDHLGLAADRLRLRQDLHLLHRPVLARAGAQPPIRRHRRRGARASPPPGSRS